MTAIESQYDTGEIHPVTPPFFTDRGVMIRMAESRLSYDRDQVRERTDLLALIGQHVALKKRGGNYLGLCPFHQEKSPSFTVDPAKGFWHCFGCGKGGDAFNFIMTLERLTFPEALERLAERAGVQPIESAVAPQRKEERDLLLEVNAAAAAAFRKALEGKAGVMARTYLEKRGLSAADAARFGLGYAPASWDALTGHLRGRGFSGEVMAKADLARARSSGDGFIDRFRNRLMIPIADRQGRVIAFGGRALAAEDNPKYLNTGETPVFHKGRTLYALHLALDTIKKRNRVIVTEGYFDVIACHLAGFTEAVATLGTALSEDHVRDLRRLAEQIYLIFDADSAGINAALRGQAMFRQAGANVRIVRLPAGHDPDTLLREGGADAFERCLADALSPVEFELEQLVRQFPERDTDSRIRLVRAAAASLQSLPRLERAEYALWLIDRWLGGTRGDVTELQRAILGEVAALERGQRPAPATTRASAAPEAPLERQVVAMMVQNAAFAEQTLGVLPAEAFTHAGYRAVCDALRGMLDAGQTPDARRVVTEEEVLAATIAALAVAELPDDAPDALLARLRDEHERRTLHPPDDPLRDPEATRAWMTKLRERSRRVQERGGYDS